MKTKKTISPIVATALLLVVAVVAGVGFQTFFNTYSTGLFSKVETQSSGSIGNTQIDTISGGILYFKNSFENIEIQSVKVNNNDCFVSGVYSDDLNLIPISNCTQIGENEIVVITNKGVYEKKIYKSNLDYSSPCPSGYSLVSGNLDLDTKNFCVMKFEAKFINYSGKADTNNVNTWFFSTGTGDKNITSTAYGGPIASINLTDAQAACQNIGSNYHLITNSQWMTIARNIEQVSTNWNSSVVGSGFLFTGHNDNGPAGALNVSDENDFYDGTNDGVSSPGDGLFANFPSNADARAYMGQKRVFILDNSELIWDFSGNAWEWVNDTIDCTLGYPCINMPYDSTPADEYIGLTAISTYGAFSYDLLRPSNSIWYSDHGMGLIYTSASNAAPSGNIHALMRSGGWNYGVAVGPYIVHLNAAPQYVSGALGFRCVYTP